MSYIHTEMDGVDVLSLADSIDLYSTPHIKKIIKNLLRNANCKIVLSMEKVTFIDSSGLGMLVNLFFESKQKGIRIKLANMSPEAKRIFVITKLIQNYEIYDTLEDAIKSFS